MTAAVEKLDQPPKLPALRVGGAIQAIVPQDFESAWRIASAVVKAGMAPPGLDTAEKCTIAILHGLEVGMPPMMALQSIAVINKRPSLWGDGALGLCQGSGLMEWYKEWYEGEPGTDDYVAICHTKRRGDPEVKVGRFSIADAKKAGLWGKAGPWQTYPTRMLKMRARAWALRAGFSDVLHGLSFAEEAQDIPMKDVTPPSPNRDAAPPGPPPEPEETTQPVERDVIDLAATARDPTPVEWTDPETGEIHEDKPAEAKPAEREYVGNPPGSPIQAEKPGPTVAFKMTGPSGLKPKVEAPQQGERWPGVSAEEADWLRDLDGALGGVEDDLALLAEQQMRVMAPKRNQVAKAAWAHAEQLVREHLARVKG